jgi:2-hydroxychromene-2-carboxylate isomerase
VKWATASAADLQVIGLWGVPSFRIGDFVTWGQDRLPLLADRLRRHKSAAA